MDIAGYILNLLIKWAKILTASIFNPYIIWVTLPVYICWFATEIFQEKKETSYGNAATNGVITSYVSLDWIRQMYLGNVKFSWIKLILALALILYGLYIMVKAIKKQPVAKILGRIKYVSYFQIMLTVLVYSEYTGIELSLDSVLSIFIGFPFIWFMTYFVDKYLPDITTEEEKSFEQSLEYGSYSNYGIPRYGEDYYSQTNFEGDQSQIYKYP